MGLRLDKARRMWEQVPKMRVARESCAAACLHGRILVVGGHDGHSFVATVEMYDIQQDSWTLFSSYPGGPLCDAACCAWRGAYYVSGGRGLSNVATVYR